MLIAIVLCGGAVVSFLILKTYLRIGDRLAESWYVPEAIRLASENRVQRVSNDRETMSGCEEEEKTVESARKVMKYCWLVLGPVEWLSDCVFLRMLF